MNIFILNSGRCGSTTFIKACEHIDNYSAAHESLADQLGPQRLAYPINHIEADNRLGWLLGKLDQLYADDAFYVHLSRDKQQTIDSFSLRNHYGIMQAYRKGILLGNTEFYTPAQIAEDYIDTIEMNIKLFLKDKTNKMDFLLEKANSDFEIFWDKISAEGNLKLALEEWKTNYNPSSIQS